MLEAQAQQPVSEPKYQLIAELGQGGMADVLLAVVRGMHDFRKLAVVKRLRANLAEDPEFLAMFLQEARIAARLSHPNVVQTFEVGHDGRNHFMAMEYLDGQAYSALLAKAGREKLELPLQLKVLMDVLEGLHYAHELRDFDGRPLNLVHRDVSPQNVFITYEGQVKLLDFGIAKALDSAVETKTGVVKGKLGYMSPEQALSGTLDRRSDLYSVGVMLWEAIARRRRWKGLSTVEMMQNIAVRHDPVLPPMNQVPPALETILRRSLSYSADERFADALEFHDALDKVLLEMGVRVTTRDVGAHMSTLFAEDRLRLDAIIEGEIKKLDKRAADTIRPGRPDSLVHLDRPPNTASSSMLLAKGYSVSQSSASDIERSETRSVSALVRAEVKRRQRRVVTLLTPLFVLALAASFVGIYLYGRHESELRAAAQPAAPPERAPVPAKSDEIEIRITATPATAILFLDDKRLGSGPYVGRLPKGSDTAEVRAEAPGFESETRIVPLYANTNLEFVLKPMPEETAKKTTGRRGYARVAGQTKGKDPPAPEPSPPAGPTPAAPTAPPVAKPAPTRPLDSDMPWK